MYCVYNVPVSGTPSQYMLLCMHIIAAREVLVLVGFFSFHGECLEFFSQQLEISLQAQERTAVLVIFNRCAYIASV